MKYLLLLLLLASGPGWGLLTWVRARNEAVATGTQSYGRGDATGAAISFAEAVRTAAPHRNQMPELLLNLGHAQVLAGQSEAATATYARLLTNSPAGLSSVAHQQLAVQAATQGELAKALNLLRQALILDPRNAGARANYEAISDYLTHRPNQPQLPSPPPPAGAQEAKPKPSPEQNASEQSKPAEKTGTQRQGEVNTENPAQTPPTAPPERRPDAAGQPDNQRPGPGNGNGAGGRGPGAGTPQPMASGNTPGTQRGLDRSAAGAGPAGRARSDRPGAEAATADDRSLQTQRERLQAMNLSPAQARQLLETLRAQEQQYLQQLTRPAAQKPDPSQPTW